MPSRAIPYLKALVHLFCLWPAVYLVMMYTRGSLANLTDPVNFITHFTGDWALWLLLADLAITPVRRLVTPLGWIIRFRRMIGLYAFFYATLHLMTYVFLFSGYDVPTAMAGLKAGHLLEPLHQFAVIWPTMRDDVLKRRFIQVGLGAWVILLLLALSSPQAVLRWMGGKSWSRLHKLVYLAGFLSLVHYFWLVKAGVRTPYKYAAIFFVLMGIRLLFAAVKRFRRPTPKTPTAAFG
jgi:methionine sulfoxide reductase heme-binding subunit